MRYYVRINPYKKGIRLHKIVLSAEDIIKNYYVGDSVLEVLKGVEFYLQEGQIISIVGVSGAGK